MMHSPQADKHPAASRLMSAMPDAVQSMECRCDQVTLAVARERIDAVCRFLRDHDDLQYHHLSDLCGMDYQGRRACRFGIVYQLYSSMLGDWLCIVIAVAEGERVPTVSGVWPAANWMERECWEMFGIYFDGHPDVRRLITIDEYEGFPLRKDFPLLGIAEIAAAGEGGGTWRKRL